MIQWFDERLVALLVLANMLIKCIYYLSSSLYGYLMLLVDCGYLCFMSLISIDRIDLRSGTNVHTYSCPCSYNKQLSLALDHTSVWDKMMGLI